MKNRGKGWKREKKERNVEECKKREEKEGKGMLVVSRKRRK